MYFLVAPSLQRLVELSHSVAGPCRKLPPPFGWDNQALRLQGGPAGWAMTQGSPRESQGTPEKPRGAPEDPWEPLGTPLFSLPLA